jgi:hypothetical protein
MRRVHPMLPFPVPSENVLARCLTSFSMIASPESIAGVFLTLCVLLRRTWGTGAALGLQNRPTCAEDGRSVLYLEAGIILSWSGWGGWFERIGSGRIGV